MVKECLPKWANGVCGWRLFHFRQSEGVIEVGNEFLVGLVAYVSDCLVAVLAIVVCRDVASGKHGRNPRLCKSRFYEFFGDDMKKMANTVLLLRTYHNRRACRSVVQKVDEVGAEHILKQHVVAHLI